MNTNNMNIIDKIQKKDAFYSKVYSVLTITYWIIIPIILIDFIFSLLSGPTEDIISSACFFLGFASIMFSLLKIHKGLKQVDYSQPTLELLKKFVLRYSLTNPNQIGAIIGALLIIFGTGPFSLKDVLFRALAFTVAIIVSFIYYRIKSKPLVDSAKELIRELEEI